jgi:putative aminopeptidase FrvX
VQDLLREIVERFLVTHSPPGNEEEMVEAARPYLAEYCDEVFTDPHDNLIGKIAGESSEDAVLVVTHKDEVATMVESIDEDGKVHLDPLGGIRPWRYGEGPFDLLGDEIVTGVLSVGSTHTSARSPKIHEAKTSKPLDWEHCYVECGLTRDELAERGVRIGARGVVGRSRKQPMYMGARVCGFGLDDKGACAASVLAAKLVGEGERKPLDVYFALTSSEEGGCSGGQYVAHHMGASTMIAVEIAPVAPEYPIEMTASPVVFYKDSFTYTKRLCDRLCALADEQGFGHQRGIFRSLGTEASFALKAGAIGRGAAIGFPTENTHGYEMAHLGAIENCARLLAAYLSDPQL